MIPVTLQEIRMEGEHVSLHSEDERIVPDSDHTSHIGLASHNLKVQDNCVPKEKDCLGAAFRLDIPHINPVEVA